MRIAVFIFCLFLSAAFSFAADEKPVAVFSEKIQAPPLIDGNPGDACWETVPLFQSGNGKGVEIKACHNDKNIYILLSFPAKSERRHQSRWTWDNKLKAYLPGNEEEEALCLFISGVQPSEGPGDLWIWRAGRTDPSGFAEDLYFYGKNGAINYDKGVICWQSRYFGRFAGEKLQRFYQRAPSGSAADVRARGGWSDGRWTVEFARKLKTGNSDDIDIDLDEGVLLRVCGNVFEDGTLFLLKQKNEKHKL